VQDFRLREGHPLMLSVSRLTFLLPLLLGFSFNSLSAFTAFFCGRLGNARGRALTFVLRNILGLPVWTIGFALAARTSMRPVLGPSTAREAAAWILIACGSAIILLALGALRGKAAAPSPGDALVDYGLYAHVRHPIHSAMVLEFFGLALLVPTPPVLLASIAGLGWLVVQSRLEEMDLCRRIPAYGDYMQRVPRFVPRVSFRPRPRVGRR
jgi:protein-S-isoprenylcysteine O-methyltransferase Ste14